MSIIEASNVSKDYGNNKGVFDINFTMKKGEVVGYLGPNGAGKTTTIRQLMGFIKSDQGKIKVFDLDSFTQADEIQKRLGYLPGECAFMDEMSGNEFISFIAAMKEVNDRNRIESLMQRFELDGRGKIRKMSKGMKQKVAIVCAFMKDCDVYILDEPTSGLDPLMQNRFIELVLEEKAKGKTILMSSHLFEEVEKCCDRAIIIKEGRIVCDHSMDELTKQKHKRFEVIFKNEEEGQNIANKYANGLYQDCVLKLSLFSDDVNEFVKTIAHCEIVDLNVETPTLEDMFMHFYGGKENE